MAFYTKANLKNDIRGGIAAAIITLPVALGFGLTTGLGPFAGMVSAVILGLLSVIFGGTDTQISSPTGSMTVVVALIVAQEIAIAGSLQAAFPVLVIIFAMTGLIQVLLGLFKFGAIIRYVPFSVVSGFMSGIGIIIIVLQLKDVFGVYDSGFNSVSQVIFHLDYFVSNANWVAVALGLGTVASIVISQKIKKNLPASLIALLGLSTIAYFANLDVKFLGSIAGDSLDGWSKFGFEALNADAAFRIVMAAGSLAFLGSLNTLLTSLVADRLTQSMHDSDKELIGQGIGNFVAGIFGGFPGSGATACTVANIHAGGRNRLSGVISALILLSILLFASNLSSSIPNAVLAGILMHIGFVLIDFKSLKNLIKVRRVDELIMLIVLVLTVFWNLLFAVIIGLILASIHFMKRMSDVVEQGTNLSKVDKIVVQVIESFTDSTEFSKKVLVKSIKGPVFFGFSSRFLKSMREVSDDVEAVVFNMSEVPYMDHSGVRTFIEVVQFLLERNVNVCFSELNKENHKLFVESDLIPKMVSDDHVFDSVEECIMWLNEPGNLQNNLQARDEFYIHPAFTPNGDGINDYWIIRKVEEYPEIEVLVTDLFENVVYQSIGYGVPWDGTLNGKLLPSGEYKYVVDIKTEVYKGSVYLFR
ncbi:MAG: SulP family inorganic anion transporter [Salibacteraceae bacterium]|jgi:sulfate permease, SulP family|nr:SulP family inorganic anion transporter [Salibacteraceae bacterium]MDP4686047.1 SulP family inorganic anion transporter [Salibacteraceae bacterium]MDP4843973.1 SulP family inorganic anion transporter [Salibacteraceae bacterium]MDP4934005.1 SulP family inorganic anion transporter [Salibacteraceae bacterium]MDP4964227.1 SulP family inorganic anion transporter [Salibacteraceae bacterium]